MKPIVKMFVTGDMMDAWYATREPNGKTYDWDCAQDAINFYEKNGYQLEWESNGNQIAEQMKPSYFKNKQAELDL